jgi:predicted methyltransferase
VEAIKPAGGRIFLSFGHRPPDEQLAAQAAIAEMGLVIDQLTPGFNSYVGAGVLAGVSDMYLLNTTEDTQPLIEGEYTGPLYTGQVRPTLRAYVCTECNRQVAVGGEAGGQFATIEDLKAKGCPGCGAHTFQLISRRQVGGNGLDA